MLVARSLFKRGRATLINRRRASDPSQSTGFKPQNKHLTNVRSSRRTLLANIAKTTLFHSHQIDECFLMAPSTYGEKLFGFIKEPKEKVAQKQFFAFAVLKMLTKVCLLKLDFWTINWRLYHQILRRWCWYQLILMLQRIENWKLTRSLFGRAARAETDSSSAKLSSTLLAYLD